MFHARGVSCARALESCEFKCVCAFAPRRNKARSKEKQRGRRRVRTSSVGFAALRVFIPSFSGPSVAVITLRLCAPVAAAAAHSASVES